MQTVNVSFPSTVGLSYSPGFSLVSYSPVFSPYLMLSPVMPPATSAVTSLTPPSISVLQSPHVVDPTNGGLNPFRLCFIFCNINVCHGCKNRYAKNAGAPHDICVQHEEWRTFSVPNMPGPQQRFGNVYYHRNVKCIQSVWAHFDPCSYRCTTRNNTFTSGVTQTSYSVAVWDNIII